MVMKDRATIFSPRPSKTDPYAVVYDRYDLCGVMVFEKQAVGADQRDEGRCVIYYFPSRSKISGKQGQLGENGRFPQVNPGDICVVGPCKGNYKPGRDDTTGCRQIVSVEKRTAGSEQIHHIVIEAV